MLESAVVAGATLAGRRILIVEDEFLVAEVIAKTLRASGAEVLGAAATVGKALDMIRSAPCLDAAVIDINLAGDMAYPIAEALIARDTPFVFATVYRRDQLPERYRQAPHCPKPLQPATLLRELQATLAGRASPERDRTASPRLDGEAGSVPASSVPAQFAADLVDWILAIAEARDRQAFGELFVALAPKIKSYMLRFGMTDPAAEGLAQEVMLTIWRKAVRFDPSRGSAMAWIYTVARDAGNDLPRRESHRDEPKGPTSGRSARGAAGARAGRS